jgi:hypothetical protein
MQRGERFVVGEQQRGGAADFGRKQRSESRHHHLRIAPFRSLLVRETFLIRGENQRVFRAGFPKMTVIHLRQRKGCERFQRQLHLRGHLGSRTRFRHWHHSGEKLRIGQQHDLRRGSSEGKAGLGGSHA